MKGTCKAVSQALGDPIFPACPPGSTFDYAFGNNRLPDKAVDTTEHDRYVPGDPSRTLRPTEDAQKPRDPLLGANNTRYTNRLETLSADSP